MGASVSTNTITVVNKVMADVSSKIIQQTKLSEDQSQIVSVHNINGDVYITGNNFYQNAYVNMKALMTALSTQEAQNEIMLQLSQEAKSMISGLNVFQISDANNSVNVLIDAMINISTEISQVCLARYEQLQRIVVARVKGNVYIQNNVFEQVASILYSCTQDVVNQNSAINSLKEKLDQSASAKAEGLSAWVVVAIIAVIVGLPVGGVVIAGKSVLKYIFPILVVLGMALLVVYATYTSTELKYIDFSNLIAATSVCLGQRLSPPTTQFQSVAEANRACMNSPDCVAIDWHALDTSKDPAVPIATPTTTMYSHVDAGCVKNIAQDKVPTVRVGKVFSGPIDPKPVGDGESAGDVYVNTSQTSYFRYSAELGRWVYERDIVDDARSRVKSMVVRDTRPTLAPGTDGAYYVYYNKESPIDLIVYDYVVGQGWVQMKEKIRGPGLVPNVGSSSNISGFKTKIYKPWLMYTGAGAVVVGLIGTAAALGQRSTNRG